ncbi:unnamed protein product [Discosporangium mesarthrocarpum]
MNGQEEELQVTNGTLKVSFSVTNWPFCNSTTPACPSGSLNEEGSFLDATLKIEGPAEEPALVASDNSATDEGLLYDLSGGDADVYLRMSEWIQTDDHGWAKASRGPLTYDWEGFAIFCQPLFTQGMYNDGLKHFSAVDSVS